MQTGQIGNFDHRYAAEVFSRMAADRQAGSGGEGAPGWLVGNCDLGRVRADALLATPAGVTFFFFREWRGPVVWRGPAGWTAGESMAVLFPGRRDQAEVLERCREWLARKLSALPGGAGAAVRAVIVVPASAETGGSALPEACREWLSVLPEDALPAWFAARGAEPGALDGGQLEALYRSFGFDVLLVEEAGNRLAEEAGHQLSTAADFYAELQAALPAAGAPAAAVRGAYGVLQDVLRRAVDQQLLDNRLAFAGLFAKLDYLFKEHHLEDSLARAVNDARQRLRHLGQLSDGETCRCFPYDLAAVCRFIAAVAGGPVIVPDALRQRFPAKPLPRTSPRRTADCVRMAVERWDEAYVYGRAADGRRLKVRYDQHGGYHVGDWGYLRGLFAEGQQLNLLRPREAEGTLFPELVIVDPDNLINVSAVAACFESYAESAKVDLLNKLKPAPCSAAILLGNLAGQLMDEAVRTDGDGHAAYAESVRGFFARNALQLAACPDLPPDFHAEAQRQAAHIRQAVREDLRRSVASFSPADVVTEPTFFSEMLGLQGRMDFLQLDYGILLEQKSGKGAFVPGAAPDAPPRYQERHYVQLLLYMALLHYNYHLPYAHIYPFLFYSKYGRGLLHLGPAPGLLFRALKVRNEMAARERAYAEGGVAELAAWTPELLNEKQAAGPLWERYTRPELERLLRPVREASGLERAYFFRFFTFLEKERLLAKVGGKTKECSGLSSLWNECLEEKEKAGNIYAGLTLERLAPGEYGGIGVLELRFAAGAEQGRDACNFRPGDIVVCYAYEPPADPDVCRGPVFRAVLEGFGEGTVRLRLRYEQTNARVFNRAPAVRWAVEHDFMDASYASLFRGLHAFLSAPKRRRDLLLTLRRPEADGAAALRGSYGGGEFDELVRRVRQARDFFLLVGPPGTGKTSFGLMNVLREELLEPGASVLLMAYTNRAVDEICSKLVGKDGIPEAGFVRLGSELSCAAPYRPYLLERRVADCPRLEQVRALISRTRVFVGTTTAFNSHPELFGMKRFDLAIVDEASQILEPHLAGLLSATHEGREAIGRFLLIGDHKQLPAVVQQSAADARVTDPALLRIGLRDCRQSLFERLLARYRTDPSVCFTLTRQGRMHRDIAHFPSQAFYQNALCVVPGTHQERPLPAAGAGRDGVEDLLATRRVAFLDAPLPESAPSAKVNPVEARMAAATVAAVRRMAGGRLDAARTVGIIVPYRNQIAAVRAALQDAGVCEAADISIDTVERFQGSQRDVIIYCFTVQRRSQLDFLAANVFTEDGVLIDRKLNVAMTRARERLLLIGHAALLAENVTFFQLLSYLRRCGCFFSVAPDDYAAGRFAVAPLPDRAPSRPVLSASASVRSAFARHVEEPLRAASPSGWPGLVLGADDEEQLQWLAYGRSRFRLPLRRLVQGQPREVSPDQLAALYALRYLPAYLPQLRALLLAHGAALGRCVERGGGRLRLVDVGCGPGTGALALLDALPALAERTDYEGVDASAAMTALAERLVGSASGGRLSARFAARLPETDVPGAPGTTLYLLSHTADCLGAWQAGRMARQMLAEAAAVPLRRVLVLVVCAPGDEALRAFGTLRDVWQPAARRLVRRQWPASGATGGQPFTAALWLLGSGTAAGTDAATSRGPRG